MKTVGIVPNHDKEAAMNFVGELVSFLKEKDCNVALTYKIAEITGFEELGVTKYELYSKSDFIIVLGGDGTLLDTGRKNSAFGDKYGDIGFPCFCRRFGSTRDDRESIGRRL